MEVHHSSGSNHQPKKWEEYLKEFLMIFLAVTLGFISENIREHITDVEKEKHYITSIISDLKEDTTNLRQILEFDRRQVKGVDSILKLSHSNMAIDSNRKSFYRFATRYLFAASTFKSSDATLQQLKSTGDFRLIAKDHVADSLTKYDSSVHNIYSQGDYYNNYFKEILSRLDDLTDITILSDTSYVKKGKITDKPLPLFRHSEENLPTLFNKIYLFKSIESYYNEAFLKTELEDAKNLIVYLKKEYDIHD